MKVLIASLPSRVYTFVEREIGSPMITGYNMTNAFKVGEAVAFTETNKPEFAEILEVTGDEEHGYVYRINVDRDSGRERVGNFPRKTILWVRQDDLEPIASHPLLT